MRGGVWRGGRPQPRVNGSHGGGGTPGPGLEGLWGSHLPPPPAPTWRPALLPSPTRGPGRVIKPSRPGGGGLGGSGFLCLFLLPPPREGAMPRAFPWGRGAHLEVVNGGGGAADQTRHWVRNVPSALLGAGGGTGDCPSPGVGAGCSSAASKGRLCWSLSSSMASERVFVPWYPCPC